MGCRLCGISHVKTVQLRFVHFNLYNIYNKIFNLKKENKNKKPASTRQGVDGGRYEKEWKMSILIEAGGEYMRVHHPFLFALLIFAIFPNKKLK